LGAIIGWTIFATVAVMLVLLFSAVIVARRADEQEAQDFSDIEPGLRPQREARL
jgi:hypothetical protein